MTMIGYEDEKKSRVSSQSMGICTNFTNGGPWRAHNFSDLIYPVIQEEIYENFLKEMNLRTQTKNIQNSKMDRSL